jgi:hypothetical protein
MILLIIIVVVEMMTLRKDAFSQCCDSWSKSKSYTIDGYFEKGDTDKKGLRYGCNIQLTLLCT